MAAPEPTVLLEGLVFPEGPRWHDGRLWFSDIHAGHVVAVDMAGHRQTIVEVPGRPSGLGWLPGGDLLVVSLFDRHLLRFDGAHLALHADLSALAPFHCNDMVVDGRGNAYVGNFGFDLWGGGAPATTNLILVPPDGAAREVADGLFFPNGTVVTPDGRTLIVGESGGRCLTAFDIAADGSLANRHTWAQLDAPPDGIALDAEGCIWVAVPTNPGAFVRVAEGGEVRARVEVPDRAAYACALGGPAGDTLFLLEAGTSDPAKVAPGNGRIRTTRAPAPRAGWP